MRPVRRFGALDRSEIKADSTVSVVTPTGE